MDSGFVTSRTGRPLAALRKTAVIAAGLLTAATAQAQSTDLGDWIAGWSDGGHWRVASSPATWHFRYNPEHRHVWALALERQRLDGWLLGASRFNNSFGQPSAYFYVGRRWPGLWGQAPLYGQVSAGMLYGYRGQFQSKVPLNYNGFSPGALVTLGWQFNRNASAAAHLLGDAGLMLQLSWELR